MNQGLYTAASGLLAQQALYDTTAQNLANVSTNGYRRQIPAVASFAQLLDERFPDGSSAGPRLPAVTTVTDTAAGAIRATDSPTDFALTGDALFTVRAANDARIYTRDGAFRLNVDGQLVTQDGCQVMGDNGPIYLNGKWSVDSRGRVLIDGKPVNQLALARFADPATAQPLGNARWSADRVLPAAGVEVRQGALEGSNVNAIAEMVNLITLTRTFEAGQKWIQATDATLDKAVNEVGRT